jgi:hypothetical protein
MDSINYEELAKEVIKQQKNQEQIPRGHKEVIVSVLQEKTRQQVPTYQPQPIVAQKTDDQGEYTNLPAYAKTAPTETTDRVEKLIDLTFEKGISYGIREMAQDDPFVIDMYHDALADRMVTKMKEKGLL